MCICRHYLLIVLGAEGHLLGNMAAQTASSSLHVRTHNLGRWSIMRLVAWHANLE